MSAQAEVAQKGTVKGALLEHLAAGLSPKEAARRVFEAGLSGGTQDTIYKYANLLRQSMERRPRAPKRADVARAPAAIPARGHNLPAPAFARYRVEYVSGRGYHVIDPEGRALAQMYGNREDALTRCDTLQRKLDAARRRMVRPCLCCGRPFESEGIHNRMCTPCRGRGDDGAGYGLHAPQRGQARLARG